MHTPSCIQASDAMWVILLNRKCLLNAVTAGHAGYSIWATSLPDAQPYKDILHGAMVTLQQLVPLRMANQRHRQLPCRAKAEHFLLQSVCTTRGYTRWTND